MSEKLGIEGIKKAVEKLKEVIESASVVLQDGKISFADISEIPELYADIRDMVVALQSVGAEAQDLSSEEIKQVLGLVLDLGMLIAKKFGLDLK
jgi:hypothetical protein